MIDITLLGTAALLPLPHRALSAAILSCGRHAILFDCGEGTQTAARRAHVNLMRADMIALTHYHGDHIFGLPGLLQTLDVMGRKKPLYLTGPEGLRQALSPIFALAGVMGYELKPMDLPMEGLRLAALIPGWPETARLCAFGTRHRVPSQGYVFTLDRPGRFQPERARELGVPQRLWGRLQSGETVWVGGGPVMPPQVMGPARKGIKVVFSGDTAACSALERAAEGADLLIADATYGENEQQELACQYGHMNFAQAGRLAQSARVKRLWLTHYSQMIDRPEAYLDHARSGFPGAVCGQDGMSVTLQFEEDHER